MKGGMASWWRSRTVREQILLIVMIGLATIVLSWLLVIRPLGDALSDARERHDEAVVTLARARAQAAAIAGAEAVVPAALSGPLDALISQSAAEAGFPVTRLDREGASQATLTIESVRPQAFFGWVDQMETARGLSVERMSVTTNSDRTLAVQVTFRSRSG